MEYYDAKAVANELGRKSGVAASGITAVVIMSLNRGWPEWWTWIGIAIFGVVVYEVVSFWMVKVLLDRYYNVPEIAAPAPGSVTTSDSAITYEQSLAPVDSDMARSVGHVVRYKSGEWFDTVDWPKLAEYVAQPRAPLSRAALDGLVDQRWYSPRNGDPVTPFPDLMVEIGAAIRVTNGGDKVAYSWSKRAPEIVARIAATPLPHSGNNRPVK